ncbi:MAG: sensor histidine kinase, partial [Acidimicrobiales bacterium]
VRNLLDNATRHAKKSVAVVLSAASEPGWIELSVSDDGDGVAPAQQDRIFERFTRSDDARDRARGGAGLGLAISRDIAVRHGGTLDVDVSVSSGARFVLALPDNGQD